jgi:hypothetical protein
VPYSQKTEPKKKNLNPKVSIDKKGLTVKSADDNFKMNIGGRLHATLADHSDEALGLRR